PSAMSKSAVNTMTQSLAVEWGRYGLRFNAIAPGPFPTEGMTKRLAPQADSTEDMNRDGSNPMGRIGKMHELVNLAVFLMGPGAEYVNGQTIAIDGASYNATGGNFAQLGKWGDSEWQAAREAIEATNAKDKAKRTV
ncbi:MAG: SDR family oxidoreductase, partial [Pseudomonadota bacterium]